MKLYYDQLFTQAEGLKLYSDYVIENLVDGSVIEMAAGSGDLLNQLSEDRSVLGVDIDDDMIAMAYKKFPNLKDILIQGDFCDFKSDTKYDNYVCIGDSLNYILNLGDLKAFVNVASDLSDHLVLDMHHPYRLVEFEDGFYEEGSLEDFDYAYQIECDDDYLMHIINFLDGTFDAIQQWVFDPEILIKLLEEKGYSIQTFNDFTKGPILEEGEKVRIVASRVSK